MFSEFQHLDTIVFTFLNREVQNSIFDLVMPFITKQWHLVVIPFVVLLYFRDRRRTLSAGVITICSVLLADGMSHVLKDMIGRIRPCSALPDVRLLVGCGKSFAMPSNHAANAFAFAAPFIVMACRFKSSEDRHVPMMQVNAFPRALALVASLFLFVALVVSFSRIYVGVHYPSDVIVGALVGSLAALLCMGLSAWAEKRYPARPFATVMYLFLLAVTLFRIHYIIYGPLDLSPDEAHYWEWSRRLDLSYYSKGPMIAYLMALSGSLFGDTVLGVRVLAPVCSLLSSLLLYRLGKEMFNETVGAFSAMLFQIVPLYATYGVVFTIDSPFILLWVLALYLFYRAVRHRGNGDYESGPTHRGDMKYWLLLGLVVGLGLLTKYTMAFFYVCGLCFIVASRGHRQLLLTVQPYISFAVSLLVFSPVLVWNVRHDWVTIKHTAGQAHLNEGLRISLKSLAEFIGSQLGVLTPVLVILIAYALWSVKRKDRGRLLFWFSMPVMLFFIAKSIQGKVQANWAMMAYPSGIVAFSTVFIDHWKDHSRWLKRTVIAGIALSVVITAAGHFSSKLPLPPKLDPSSRLRGWKELGREVGLLYEEMTAQKDVGGKGPTYGEPPNTVFIFSDRYQVASQLAFYVPGNPRTYCVNLGRRMNQYDLWPTFHELLHYDAVFVTIGDKKPPEAVAEAFAECRKKPLKVYERDTLLRQYSLFTCYDFKGIKERGVDRY